jgi:uncharacterized protein (TIGR00266 family)
MKVEIRHSPAYAVGRCFIQPGETINVEAGAMYAQSDGIRVESKMEGGLFGAAKRALLSGDSFFVSKFSNVSNKEVWVDVVPPLPGDMFELDVLPGNPVILTKGVFLASDLGVKMDPKFGGSSSFFGGEGLFVIKAEGQGKLVGTAYGALDTFNLAPGEKITVDTGHLVAYEEGMQVNIRKISKGILGSMKSGEGLVMDITGPGDVITQSRNPSAFSSWIASIIPSSGGSSGGGGLGGLGSLLN